MVWSLFTDRKKSEKEYCGEIALLGWQAKEMQDSGPDKHLPEHFTDAEVEEKCFVLFITDKHLLLWGKTKKSYT